jgi:hypothetical protein
MYVVSSFEEKRGRKRDEKIWEFGVVVVESGKLACLLQINVRH